MRSLVTCRLLTYSLISIHLHISFNNDFSDSRSDSTVVFAFANRPDPNRPDKEYLGLGGVG